ncbi:MAG: CCDC90 family protein [Magnetococcus sp. YQC-5]
MTHFAMAFDTHKFIKQMMATGFTEQQAESQVNLLAEILNNQLSTKADVATNLFGLILTMHRS